LYKLPQEKERKPATPFWWLQSTFKEKEKTVQEKEIQASKE
jgi:hypothetical protein